MLLGILSWGILGGHIWELDRNTLGTDKTQTAEVLHYLIAEALCHHFQPGLIPPLLNGGTYL